MNYLENINLENIVKWCNHLHENPELSFEEYETSQYIFDVLTSFGDLEITRPTQTSVVAVLDTGIEGKTVALRADMDALPVEEDADVDYKSKVKGKMHACGHDTHVAMLLGAAEALVKSKDGLTGKVKFIFQHAEELLPGGAQELVKAGVMDGVDEVYGIHTLGGSPSNYVGARVGAMTASADTFKVHLTGKGSHGSAPETSIDLVVVTMEIINAFQAIVSRNVTPLEPAVVTVGQLNIGTADNIIAHTGYFTGTVRATNPKTRKFIEERIYEIIECVCKMNGAKYEIEYIHGYSAILNNEKAFATASAAAKKIVGEENFTVLPTPIMGGEDFSAYAEVAPGCFMWLGGGDGEDYDYYNHHPKFRTTSEALYNGAKIHTQIIFDILGK